GQRLNADAAPGRWLCLCGEYANGPLCRRGACLAAACDGWAWPCVPQPDRRGLYDLGCLHQTGQSRTVGRIAKLGFGHLIDQRHQMTITRSDSTTLPPAPVDATAPATQTPEASTPAISVVIPLYNEEESIPHLYEALTEALDAYGRPYEVIIVDDGSKDRSFALLRDLAARDDRFT